MFTEKALPFFIRLNLLPFPCYRWILSHQLHEGKLKCPPIVYMDLNGLRLLGAFGEVVPPAIPGV